MTSGYERLIATNSGSFKHQVCRQMMLYFQAIFECNTFSYKTIKQTLSVQWLNDLMVHTPNKDYIKHTLNPAGRARYTDSGKIWCEKVYQQAKSLLTRIT